MLSKVAASYTWEAENTMLVNLKFIENIHGDQWTCTFNGKSVSIALKNDKSIFYPEQDKRSVLFGRF